jgi:hypothetical protein
VYCSACNQDSTRLRAVTDSSTAFAHPVTTRCDSSALRAVTAARSA